MQELNFFEAGNGFPLVFIHGFCESNKIWEDLSEELSDEFRIICPDLPGFGKSTLPSSEFSLEQIGDHLVQWLRDLGISRCMVIGHSLGGYTTLEILRKYPDFVQSIGLFNSSAFADTEDKKENRNKLIQFIREYGVATFLKTFVPSLFYPPTAGRYQNVIDQISSDGTAIAPEAVMYYAAAMRDRQDSIDLLKKYSGKILVIAGEHDQNVPLTKTREMAAYLPEGHVHIIPESAHMSLFEESRMCYDAIRKFATKISSS
jgi:pimeloyl-ACP methyl ester carboxylesterase